MTNLRFKLLEDENLETNFQLFPMLALTYIEGSGTE